MGLDGRARKPWFNVTVKNLKVVKIEQEKNLLYLKGAVPGAKNGYLIITKAK